MSSSLMIFPMFAMFSLTLFVFILLFVDRFKAVKKGKINPKHFLTYTTDQIESRKTIAKARQFANLFETPVLFYAACLAVMTLKITTSIFLGLAWGYVLMRVLHAFIHMGANHLIWRICAYFGSWLFLIGLWGGLLFEALAS